MKILAVDPDPLSLRLLEQHCRELLAGRLTLFARAWSLETADAQLEKTPFDLVLLEPTLPDGDGLHLLARHPGRNFQTVLVSAQASLALRAYEHGVLDFVPKPVRRDRLDLALQRTASTPANPGGQFIAVRHAGRIDLIAVDDLLYAEGADKYAELVLADGRRSFYDRGLRVLESSLPADFVRIHKSYLVRFPLIARLLVRRGSRYFAELRGGQRLPVGRTRYTGLKARLL